MDYLNLDMRGHSWGWVVPCTECKRRLCVFTKYARILPGMSSPIHNLVLTWYLLSDIYQPFAHRKKNGENSTEFVMCFPSLRKDLYSPEGNDRYVRTAPNDPRKVSLSPLFTPLSTRCTNIRHPTPNSQDLSMKVMLLTN